MAAFCEMGAVQEVLARGETKSSIRTSDGIQVDLRVVEPAHYGAALAYFTGSKAHNVRLRALALKQGLTLNEYGLAKLAPEDVPAHPESAAAADSGSARDSSGASLASPYSLRVRPCLSARARRRTLSALLPVK